jgi:hypothetical protein
MKSAIADKSLDAVHTFNTESITAQFLGWMRKSNLSFSSRRLQKKYLTFVPSAVMEKTKTDVWI